MSFAFLTTIGLLVASVTGNSGKTVSKDVVVVGGGSSGCYAAVTLRDTYKKSILLIEKEAILGGHVDSFTDPTTGETIDYGVKSFLEAGNSTALFDKMGIDRGTSPSVTTETIYVDYLTGEIVDYTPPDITAQIAALEPFLDAVEPYEHLLQPSYTELPTGKKIPEDLLNNFGDFVEKYGFADALPFIYETTGLGLGNMTAETTMFVLQAFGASMARSVLGLQSSYVPASLRNQDLYDAIGKHLGDDVMYNSTVTSTTRSNDGVTLKVSSTCGTTTTVKAKRLLIAIEPTSDNMAVFDLSKSEKKTLGKFTYTNEYTGIVDNPSFANATTYMNLPSEAAPNDTMTYPVPSDCARFDWQGIGAYFRVTIVGDNTLTASGAKKVCQEAYTNMLETGVLDSSEVGKNDQLHWNAFSAHGPMHARVTPQLVYDGFYKELYALQGGRSTFWTGGAWSVNFQTTLWQFDDLLMPDIIKGI